MTEGGVLPRARAEERLERLLAYERELHARGERHIAGVDEAGLGPLAGPVVAAAVVFPPGIAVLGADDSKRLTARQREALDRTIRERALSFGIALATVEEIEERNIRQAGLLAMRRAIDALSVPLDRVLLDARLLPGLPWPQEAFIKADAKFHAVACASILAKVFRDRLMDEYDDTWPAYGFRRHRGYATAAHRAAIALHGPCPIHRRGFHSAGTQIALFPPRGSEAGAHA